MIVQPLRHPAAAIDWFALRTRRPHNPNRRTTVLPPRRGDAFEAGRKPTRVFVPEVILRRAGFEVFLPVRKEYRIKNRYTREKHRVAYPLLVDWIFVGWPTGTCRWSDLMALDVVTGVLGTGGRPVQVSCAVMLDIMRRWGGGHTAPEHHRFMRTHAEFSAGDIVRVVDGPFDGHEVRVIEIDGPRVHALVDLLGGDIPVKLSAYELEPVGRRV